MRKIKRLSWPIIAMAGFALVFIALPLVSVLFRTPWSDISDLLSVRQIRQAVWISLYTSLISALLCVLFGVPLAWFLARSEMRGIKLLRAICITPMVLPPVVGGIALLSAFGRRGLLGQWLYDWWGVSLPFTRTAVVMAQVFVAIPFLVLALESSFRQLDTGLEDAARTLGASPMRIFFTVVLPSSTPALIAGFVLAWARSLGEFGASITFAGSFPGKTQTLPMAVYEYISIDYRQSLVLSLILIAISVAVLGAMRGQWMRTDPS